MSHPENKPPIATAPLSVAIPVRNQAALLETRLTAWLEYLRTLAQPFEVLLVDDASNDDTFAAAECLAVKHAEVIPIRLEQPAGIGAALRRALELARHPLFFYTTLDYPYEPSDLKKLLDRIDELDLVTGFRGGRREPLWHRLWRHATDLTKRVVFGIPPDRKPGWLGTNALIYARLMRLIFGVHVVDVDSAFKLFRREVFARIPIQSDGPFVHTEIIAKANFMTCWMEEIAIGGSRDPGPPILWRERWADMKRVLRHADFGPWPVPAAPVAAGAAGPPASAPRTEPG